MNILEYYKNQHYVNKKYVDRKSQIPLNGNINLFGVRGSGKSALILDMMQNEDEDKRLYIDLDDPKLILSPITSITLQNYVNKLEITLLILDHYKEEYFNIFPIIGRVIVISRIPLDNKKFIPVELFPLDYEEFLAFENSSSATNTFNHFIKAGTLPMMTKHYKSNLVAMKNFIQMNFNINEQKLLIILTEHNTKHITINQLYTFAKERFKISKDWIYSTIKNFKEEKLIFFIDEQYQKSGKKIIIFDFAFSKYLTINQPFIIQFDTMVALALLKHSVEFKTLGIHGYITSKNELIIIAPFESEDSLWVKSQNKFSIYKKYGVKKVTIVTVANSYEYLIEKLSFEALPFYEWTIINNENQD